ncbi:MAG: Gfo/Idh/MocA family oxidoreductase [Lentisphaerae bacterium]|nr:Gfo/Idh/MocA family oxidoreductase [Lentisphaerota bacterium]
MQQEVTIALAGCGGYGRNYLRQLLDPPADARIRVVGLVDPRPPAGPEADQALSRGWPLFKDLGEFFGATRADLVILATPIHLHAPQTIMALENGANVVCEKPLAATVQDALSMTAAEKRTGKFVAIGYQSSFSPALQNLKRDIRAGVLGRPLRMKTIYLWPRPAAYYRRNNWAGALRAADGAWILDSPVNNATAHFLHNMFYVLGSETACRTCQCRAHPVV